MAGDLTGVILDGRYRVIEPISEGAMGVVYRAERVKLGRIVAIKVLHDELPPELSSRERFEIEATAMAKLEHPHCASVLDVGVHEGKPFVVMDFVSGDNLRDVVARGPLPLPRAVDIVRQVLTGLAHAHEHNIIHRDIKPANIVLSQKSGLGDHVKILDFGLARITDTPKLTTGIVVGTPAYMAPEQIRGVLIDHRADLYACGVLLFELLTGTKPFISEKDDPVEVCSMHLKNAPPTLATKQPGIEFGILEAIVARALSKKPEDRYPNAVEFATALEAIPRRASIPPSAPITAPIAGLATETGWAVPEDAKSSMFADEPAPVPVAAPVTAPVAAPVPVSEPVTAPTVPPAAPMAWVAPEPAPAAPVRAGKQPPAPFSRPTRPTQRNAPGAASFDPSAAIAATEAAASAAEHAVPPPPSPPRGLPSDFDLSVMIPRGSPAGASEKGLSPAFDLSVAIPSPAEPKGLAPGFDVSLAIPQADSPVLERSGSVSGPTTSSTETKLGLVAASGPTETKLGLVAAKGASETQPGVPFDPRTPAAPVGDVKATAMFVGAPPAGPSPLLISDVPVSLPPPPVPKLPVSKRQFYVIGAMTVVIVLFAIIARTCGGGVSKEITKPKPAPTEPTAPVVEPKRDPADEQVEQITEMIEAGNARGATEQLLAARKVFPKDARLSYLLGKLYFERQSWTMGLKQFRETLELDPTYRADPDLIRAALKAFLTPADYPADLGAFLRNDIGAPAVQYLEETAASHPRAGTRARAKAELATMKK